MVVLSVTMTHAAGSGPRTIISKRPMAMALKPAARNLSAYRLRHARHTNTQATACRQAVARGTISTVFRANIVGHAHGGASVAVSFRQRSWLDKPAPMYQLWIIGVGYSTTVTAPSSRCWGNARIGHNSTELIGSSGSETRLG